MGQKHKLLAQDFFKVCSTNVQKSCCSCYWSDFLKFFMLVNVLPCRGPQSSSWSRWWSWAGRCSSSRSSGAAAAGHTEPSSCQQEELFFYFFSILLNTASSAAHQIHCVGGCWDRTQEQLWLRHWLSDALTIRLGLIHETKKSYLHPNEGRNYNNATNKTNLTNPLGTPGCFISGYDPGKIKISGVLKQNLRITESSPFTVRIYNFKNTPG